MGCDMGWIAATEPDRLMDGFDVEFRTGPVQQSPVTGTVQQINRPESNLFPGRSTTEKRAERGELERKKKTRLSVSLSPLLGEMGVVSRYGV